MSGGVKWRGQKRTERANENGRRGVWLERFQSGSSEESGSPTPEDMLVKKIGILHAPMNASKGLSKQVLATNYAIFQLPIFFSDLIVSMFMLKILWL